MIDEQCYANVNDDNVRVLKNKDLQIIIEKRADTPYD